MINELIMVEKLIKDRLTEKATELTKAVWQEPENENLYAWLSPMGTSQEIDHLTITLNRIRHEISTLQTQKHNK